MNATTPRPAVDRRILRALVGTTRHNGRSLSDVRHSAGMDSADAWAQLQLGWRNGLVGRATTGAFGGVRYWLTDAGRACLDVGW